MPPSEKDVGLRHQPELFASGLELCLQSTQPARELVERAGRPPCTQMDACERAEGKALKYNVSESWSLVCPASSQLPWTKGAKGPFSEASMCLGTKGAGPRTW